MSSSSDSDSSSSGSSYYGSDSDDEIVDHMWSDSDNGEEQSAGVPTAAGGDMGGPDDAGDDVATRQQDSFHIRSKFEIMGFQDGVEVGREAAAQEGFDMGYMYGAGMTFNDGVQAGVLRSCEAFLVAHTNGTGGVDAATLAAFQAAAQALISKAELPTQGRLHEHRTVYAGVDPDGVAAALTAAGQPVPDLSDVTRPLPSQWDQLPGTAAVATPVPGTVSQEDGDAVTATAVATGATAVVAPGSAGVGSTFAAAGCGGDNCKCKSDADTLPAATSTKPDGCCGGGGDACACRDEQPTASTQDAAATQAPSTVVAPPPVPEW